MAAMKSLTVFSASHFSGLECLSSSLFSAFSTAVKESRTLSCNCWMSLRLAFLARGGGGDGTESVSEEEDGEGEGTGGDTRDTEGEGEGTGGDTRDTDEEDEGTDDEGVSAGIVNG